MRETPGDDQTFVRIDTHYNGFCFDRSTWHRVHHWVAPLNEHDRVKVTTLCCPSKLRYTPVEHTSDAEKRRTSEDVKICKSCERMAAKVAKAAEPAAVMLSYDDLSLLLAALDSHEYWQLSDGDERSNGYSTVEDGEKEEIDECRALYKRLESIQRQRR